MIEGYEHHIEDHVKEGSRGFAARDYRAEKERFGIEEQQSTTTMNGYSAKEYGLDVTRDNNRTR